jgi:hypothetical protein
MTYSQMLKDGIGNYDIDDIKEAYVLEMEESNDGIAVRVLEETVD